MNVLKLIASDSFITVSKELIKKVGLEEAILLGELASESDYWQKNKGMTEDGYFFSTIENIEEKTTLSEYKQRRCLNNLKDLGIVSVIVKGMPAKRYIKINEAEVLKILENKLLNNSSASSVISQELVTEKLKGNNNIKNNNINNNINGETSSPETKEDNSSSKKRISKKEQLTDYINSLAYNAEIKDILFKWLFSIGLNRNVHLQQFKDMLAHLEDECNKDESLIKDAINNSYLNNWFGFYRPKTVSHKLPSATLNINNTPFQPPQPPAVSDMVF